MKFPLSLPIATALLTFPALAAADPVTDTCLLYEPAEVCGCATEALTASLSAAEFAAYAAVAERALGNQKTGMGLADAWTKATEAHAAAGGLSGTEATRQINAFGKAHRDAMKRCKG